MKSGATVYRSRIDWWLWAVLVFVLTVIIVVGIVVPWWLTALLAIFIGGMTLMGVFGIWYAIDDDSLLIYQFCRPRRIPVRKIKELKYCTGILSAPALSFTRIAIRLTDSTPARSSLPLEISPRDRDGFVNHLLQINPDIKVIRQ